MDGNAELAHRVGDVVVVFHQGEYAPDDFAEDSSLVGYDDHTGEVVWRSVSTSGPMEPPTVTAAGDALIVPGTDRVRALDARSGEERWAVDGFWEVLGEHDGVLVLAPDHDAFFDPPPPGRTLLVEAGSGDVVADLPGTPFAVGTAGVSVLDGDTVRQLDLDGEERWATTLDRAGPDAGVVDGAAGDGLVLLSVPQPEQPDRPDRPDRLVALDADGGAVLWQEEAYDADVLERGPDGRVAALRLPSGSSSYDDGTAELVLYGRSGEVAATEVPLAAGRYGVTPFLAVPGTGDFLVSGPAGVVIDADLDVARHDGIVVGAVDEGVYVLDGTTLRLAAWDSTEEREVATGVEGDVLPVDGALLVAHDDRLTLLR
ncbi:PQQ-like beta-propeller repeat protein [Nocardioides sp. TF02-7]|nr:PQQ-like beta-propeller repeat protein [Nocardioides sp. TF02-7]